MEDKTLDQFQKGDWIIVDYENMSFVAVFDRKTYLGNVKVKYQSTIRGPEYECFGGILDQNFISIRKADDDDFQDNRKRYQEYCKLPKF